MEAKVNKGNKKKGLADEEEKQEEEYLQQINDSQDCQNSKFLQSLPPDLGRHSSLVSDYVCIVLM